MFPSKVAVRTLALEREELISQGRKVVCPDNRLICDSIPLMFARALVEDFFFFRPKKFGIDSGKTREKHMEISINQAKSFWTSR